MMTEDPIVVTGVGLVTPLGTGQEVVWKRLVGGQSGIRPIDRFDTSSLATKIAGLVPSIEEDPAGLNPEKILPAKDRRKIDLFTLYALAAAEEALGQSGWRPVQESEKERTATIIGTGIGGLPTITEAVRTLETRGPRKLSPFVVPQFLGNLAAGNLSIRYGFRGPIGSPVTACAASLQAIGDGMRMLKSNEADVAVVGGTEACVDPLGLAGFNAARALSTQNENPTRASRPYDKSRSGFVLSEGSGVLVIEHMSHAQKRGAKPLAVLSGYGTSADAHHITAGPEDGSGAALAVKRALVSAGTSPSDIDYINGHATSTPIGDKGEVAALRLVFGTSLPNIPISSTKSSTGHLLGAAGSVEAIFTILAVRNAMLPGTLNFSEPDVENADLDFIPDLGRRAKIDTAVCNAFGFGGVNASMVVNRVND